MQQYSEKMERHVKLFYDSLSEKDRRRHAAVEAEYEAAGNPIFSIDTEFLGDLARAGDVYTTEAIKTLDHDYPS